MTDAISVVRRFNRSYTQRIGVLEDSFLGTGMPLAVARLLFEIGLEPATALALRERLGLDSGYLSRLLRFLEREGLVAVVPDPADRRRRQVSLTEAGQARWTELERRSDERARLLVDPLTERQAGRLARALAEADLLVRAATVTFLAVHPAQAMAREAVGRYFAEIGRRFGFDPRWRGRQGRRAARPARGRLRARDLGRHAGGLRRPAHDRRRRRRAEADVGPRRLARGRPRLAAAAPPGRPVPARWGWRWCRLDTNGALTEAISMYERAGYQPVDRYNDNPWATHFFEKSLSRPGR